MRENPRCWRTWSDSEIVSAVKLACEQSDEVITVGEYNALHREYPDTYPSLPTIAQRMGWSAAVRMAGYEPRSRGRAGQRDYEPLTQDLSNLYFDDASLSSIS